MIEFTLYIYIYNLNKCLWILIKSDHALIKMTSFLNFRKIGLAIHGMYRVAKHNFMFVYFLAVLSTVLLVGLLANVFYSIVQYFL